MTTTIVSATTSDGLAAGHGDTIVVIAGGGITNTTVGDGGLVNVDATGFADGTTVTGTGSANFAGRDVATVISSGGNVQITGKSVGATVGPGGEEDINASGTATSATILSGGYQLANDATAVVDGGTVLSGGLSELSLGSSTNLALSGGEQQVDEGAAMGTVVAAGGQLLLVPVPVEFGAAGLELTPIVTSNVIVSSGGTEIAQSLVGTEQILNPDGSLALTEVLSAGTLTLTYGATIASDGTNLSGDKQVYTPVGSGFTFTETAPDGTTSSFADQNGYIAPTAGAADTHVLSGGTFIFDGATVQNLAVDSGGIEIIGGGFVTQKGYTEQQTGVYVFNNHVTSGVLAIVSSGGQDISGVLQVGAEEEVYSGAAASATRVFYGAEQLVLGGSTTGTSVSSGGQQVLFGGRATGTLLSGATQVVSSGAVASGTMLTASSLLTVLDGGSALGATVDDSFMTVSSGGFAQSTIIQASPRTGGAAYNSAGGASDFEGLVVEEGATANNTRLLAASYERNYGTSTSDFISGGAGTNEFAKEYVTGRVIDAIVVGAYSLIECNGDALHTTLSGGGLQVGNYASGTLILDGGHEGDSYYTIDSVVSSGGLLDAAGSKQSPATVQTTTIFTGGMQTLYEFSTAFSTKIMSGGLQNVAGGVATSSIVDAGGTEAVSSGGSATFASVLGSEIVMGGGTAAAIAVSSGGTLTISSGGVASGASISAGGGAIISAGGSAVLDSIGSGGVEFDYGAAISATVTSGGQENVMRTGVASATLVLGGGSDTISAGGSALAARIETGGSESVLSGGVAIGTEVALGGGQVIAAGGFASGTVVDGGTQTVQAGGAVNATTVSLDGTVLVAGAARQSIVDGDGTVKILGGGSTTGTQVNAGGLEIVLAGGSAVGTMVNAGGAQGVSAGGTAIDTTIAAGGTEKVASGGMNLNPIVFGTLIDENGDPTISATVESGGVELVASGASAVDTTVMSGGTLIVLPGAMPTGTVVQPGGTVVSTGVVVQQPGGPTRYAPAISGTDLTAGANAFVLSAGSAAATTIEAGAAAYVEAGGIARDTIVRGGLLDLAAGDAAAGAITFGDGPGTLRIEDHTSLAATLAGFAGGDTIDLAAFAYDPAGRATLGANGVLTVTEGALTFTAQLSGSYAGDVFHLGADSGAGTEVTVDTVPCFCRGTLIQTEGGERPVEALAIGDRLLTAGGAVRPIRWIGRRSYAGPFVARNPAVLPILFRAGALGDGLPRRDLWVSPLHAMFLDGVLIPAELLVNGVSIVKADHVDQVEYFHVELDSHDILLAEGAPAESFVDCDSRALFHNAHTFTGDAPRWSFCAPRVEDGSTLARIRERLRPGKPPVEQSATRGYLDRATHEICAGWACLPADPEATVEVEILVDDAVIARVTANLWRADVKAHGVGTGRYGFELTFAQPLAPFRAHAISARVVGGAMLDGVIHLEPRAGLDLGSLPALAAALQARAADGTGAREVRAFLMDQLHATRAARQRRGVGPLALVLDHQAPQPPRDAGSAAIVSHMRSLQRLGYQVVFVPLDGRSGVLPAGIECAAMPDYSSVEDALRQHREAAVVYVHRVSSMALYGALVRSICPGARLIYGVADLHFLRLGRQAVIEGSVARAAESRRVRAQEIAAASLADMVVTHSAAEADVLRRLIPGVSVGVVPWSVTPGPAPYGWRRRSGVVFVGGMAHAPNADAVRWLAAEVMPRIVALEPNIRCRIVGAGLTDADRTWLHPAMDALGPMPDLTRLYRSARLAVAPLRFGAGVKGKVLEAFAAGLPCVLTPVAAEGWALPEALHRLIAADADAFARLVVALHADQAGNRDAGAAGRAFVADTASEQAVDRLLQNVVASARAPRRRHWSRG